METKPDNVHIGIVGAKEHMDASRWDGKEKHRITLNVSKEVFNCLDFGDEVVIGPKMKGEINGNAE